jgi:4-hydroxy-tetrahydrodipicolinate reductase
MEIDTVEESWSTATAPFPVDSGTEQLGILPPGRVVGIAQEGRGVAGGQTTISMRLVMYYQPERHGLTPSDTIAIDGAHQLRAEITPAAVSLFGAANTVVNATHDTLGAPPGLLNVLDFSIGGDRRGGFRYVTDPDRPPVPGSVALRRAPLA